MAYTVFVSTAEETETASAALSPNRVLLRPTAAKVRRRGSRTPPLCLHGDMVELGCIAFLECDEEMLGDDGSRRGLQITSKGRQAGHQERCCFCSGCSSAL
ncbi:hypothetical protein HPP92_001211 [Vanilla planifolia]|uniref:Uncharacterized protein n=1 Tax=Vanilla planifolia TaxID=51239 RepID=A0A835RQ95_VANPL|nr:hypothetical protein HPP92_001211 [Vanilla planifolia]